MRSLVVFIAVLTLFTQVPVAQTPAEPLAIARILAAKYPAQPIMSYIPALSWSSNCASRPSRKNRSGVRKPTGTFRRS